MLFSSDDISLTSSEPELTSTSILMNEIITENDINIVQLNCPICRKFVYDTYEIDFHTS